MRERRESREKTVNLKQKLHELKLKMKVRVTQCHKVAYIAIQDV